MSDALRTSLRRGVHPALTLCAGLLLFCLGLAGRPDVAEARLPVRSAILMNLNTGKILYQQQADASIPPASLTKVMTMFLTMDAVKAGRISLNKKIRISRHSARVGGSSMHLRAGERVPLSRLLTGMAVASGNDAATAVAPDIHGSRKNFVRQMNRKARQLGMKRTVFKNPTGLPAAGQKTTARDMLTLARAYIRTHPAAMRFHKTHHFLHRRMVFTNTNSLLGKVKGVDGLKTGWTVASGYNLIITAKRGNTRLLAVVMGGQSRAVRDKAARRLLEAGFKYSTSPQKVRRALR